MADPNSRRADHYRTEDTLAFVRATHDCESGSRGEIHRAAAQAGMPEIMLAPEEGRFLTLLTRLAGVRRAVEVGTLAGYSALAIAEGLAEGGKLISLELSSEYADNARANLSRAGFSDRVEIRVGDARSTLESLSGEGPFDMVFLDADKQGYPEYADWAFANLRPGGLLVGDNSYLFGRLMEDSEEARAMRRFHERVAARCLSTCIPTPDGLVVGLLSE